MKVPKPKDSTKARNLQRWLNETYRNNGNPMFAFLWQLDYFDDNMIDFILEGRGKEKISNIEEFPFIHRSVEIHEGYEEWIKMIEDKKLVDSLGRFPTRIFGQYHYLFKDLSNDNEISLVEFFSPYHFW